ncbi:MAG: glycosyltransferase family 2 protein [bacterium]
MSILGWILVVLTGLLAAGMVYLYLLALIGFLARLAGKSGASTDTMRFLVLVPAHNEGEGLLPTLNSLKGLVTKHSVELGVIADNCTDTTAEVARQAGVVVLERTDPDRRGKGHALRWAITEIGLDSYDAVAVVDADTIVMPNMLEAMAAGLQYGADAVQTCYQFTPSDESSTSQLQYIASLVENHLFYKPRAILGFPSILRGSGMAVRSEILAEHPFDSSSITEDVDFSIRLSKLGHRVQYTSASTVFSAATVNYQQATTQKSRWASGTFALIADHFIPLIGTGLRGRPGLIELAFSLLLVSRPLLVFGSGVLMLLGLLVSGTLGRLIVAANAAIAVFVVVYLLLGILLTKDKGRAIRALAHIPAYGLWFLGIQLRSLLGFRRDDWQRTQRKTDV